MKSLFIGRFQPFHKGHQLIIKKIKNNFEKINIGIGSSQYHHTITNPFTSDERKLMIKKSLEEIWYGKKFNKLRKKFYKGKLMKECCTHPNKR